MADQLMEASVQGAAMSTADVGVVYRLASEVQGVGIAPAAALTVSQALPLMGASVQGEGRVSATMVSYGAPASGRRQVVELGTRVTWEES